MKKIIKLRKAGPVAGKSSSGKRLKPPATGKKNYTDPGLLREVIKTYKAATSASKDLTVNKYRALIESFFDLIYVVGHDDKIRYVNPSGLKRLGLSAEDVVGQPRTSLFTSATAARQKTALNRVFASGKSSVSEQSVGASGNKHYEETRLIPLKDTAGKTSSVLGISRDVTERKKPETVPGQDEGMLRSIFETARDNIFIKDITGHYIKINQSFADVVSLSRHDTLGKTDKQLFPADVATEVFRDDRKVIRTGKTLVSSYERKLPSGKYYFNTIKTPLRDAAGKIIGVIGIARDVIQLKKEERKRAMAMVSDVVDKMARPLAHDFNNALTAINGFATLIDYDLPSSSPIKTEIAHILKAVKRATELVTELQDLGHGKKAPPGRKPGLHQPAPLHQKIGKPDHKRSRQE